jgi:hypothetical protein
VSLNADGSKIHTVHDGLDITHERRDEIFAAVDAIAEDVEQEELNHCVRRFQELFAIKGNLVARSQQLYASGDPLADKKLNSEVRIALFDWLQALRAYLDHTEARIKRQYGKDSVEARHYIQTTNELFDGFFAYRFVCKLRNAQHVDFAQISVIIRDSGNDEPAGVVVFNRDALLETYDGWGSVAGELKKFPESFSMDEIVATMMQCIGWLAYEVAEIDRPTVEKVAAVVNGAIADVPAGPGRPVLICLPDESEESEIQWRNLHPVEMTSRERPTIVGRPTGRGDEWATWGEGAKGVGPS